MMDCGIFLYPQVGNQGFFTFYTKIDILPFTVSSLIPVKFAL